MHLRYMYMVEHHEDSTLASYCCYSTAPTSVFLQVPVHVCKPKYADKFISCKLFFFWRGRGGEEGGGGGCKKPTYMYVNQKIPFLGAKSNNIHVHVGSG